MTDSVHLLLPYLAAGQAQKHVTVNESLRKLDAVVQLSVVSATTTAEPGAPSDGAVYIVPSGKSGTHWAAFTNWALAYYRDGAWEQIAPREGFRAWVADADKLLIYDGAGWIERGPAYACGAFTPTVTFATPGDLSVSYNVQVGRYVRHGKSVWIDVSVQFIPTFTTASGRLEILGLPFAADTVVGSFSIRNLSASVSWPAGTTYVSAGITAGGGNRARVLGVGPGVGASEFGAAHFVSRATHTVAFAGTYQTA